MKTATTANTATGWWCRQRVGVFGVVLACVVVTACTRTAHADDRLADAGAALFNGAASMRARLAGSDDELPGLAVRCTNCHERPVARPDAVPVAAGGQTSPAGRSYASALNRDGLTTARVRHGGPSTRYDASSFCTLLRSGVDPAQVLIPAVMPRYDATDAQCGSLWAFLRSR